MPDHWYGPAILLGLLLGMGFDACRESIRAPLRQNVHNLTDHLIIPYSRAKPVKGFTLYDLGNHLIWVACTLSAEKCQKHECLLNVLSRNETAVREFCASVKHDCPNVENNCWVDAECRSYGHIVGNAILIHVSSCDDEPSGDYEYGDKVIRLDPNE